MKLITQTLLGVTLGVGLLAYPLYAESERPGYIDFGPLTPSAKGDFVEVNVSGNLLGIAARLAAKQEPDAAELIRGLRSVRVNVVGLDDGNRSVIQERLRTLSSELITKGWERIVTVKEKAQEVGVYLKSHSPETIEGIVITVSEGGKQAVLVNIEGDIKPDKIAELGEKLHLAPLQKVAESLNKK